MDNHVNESRMHTLIGGNGRNSRDSLQTVSLQAAPRKHLFLGSSFMRANQRLNPMKLLTQPNLVGGMVPTPNV